MYKPVKAQLHLHYGLEAGFAFSQFKEDYSNNNEETYSKVRESITAVYSPLLGVSTDLIYKKHLFFSVGFQYQMVGQKYRNHYERNNIGAGTSYILDCWENQTFHKLCMPITFGYTLKIKQIRPVFFIGYRPNYFLTGTYYYKTIYDDENSVNDLLIEKQFNPLDSKANALPVQHFQHQFFYGFSLILNEKFKLSVVVNLGKYISYNDNSLSCFRNKDYVASISYMFGK